MMTQEIRWLQISYWTGAILDAYAAIALLFPRLSVDRWMSFAPSVEVRSASWVAASLMVGWTILLLWANQKPAERKGILLVTLIPITGLMLNRVVNIIVGVATIANAIPVLILQGLLFVLFTSSYFKAEHAA